MTQLAQSATAIAPAVAPDAARHAEDRLPLGHSVLLIAALSLGLWTGIALLVRWAFG